MKKRIVIADWTQDSLRCQELQTIVSGYLNEPIHPAISFVHTSHSSIHAGFLADQIAAVEERFGRPLDTVIFIDLPSENAELLIARLKTGLHVMGTNTGNVYSFLKNNFEAVFHYPDIEKEGKFRTRDAYYRVLAHLLESKQDDLDLEEVHTSQIPLLQDYYVGHIDSYGNIKTSVMESMLKETYDYNDTLKITIGDITRDVRYVASLDDAEIGELVFFPGSSGTLKDPYMDIAIRQKFSDGSKITAVSEFDQPAAGAKVLITGL